MENAFIRDIHQNWCHFYNPYRCHAQNFIIQQIMVNELSSFDYFNTYFYSHFYTFTAIELASGDYGVDKVKTLSNSIGNGECIAWYENPNKVMKLEELRQMYPITGQQKKSDDVDEQYKLKILLQRGVIKTKRDQTLTHLRIFVNILVAILLGWLFIGSGSDGSRVIANYNLMFAILIHHVFSAMMLTILTCKNYLID